MKAQETVSPQLAAYFSSSVQGFIQISEERRLLLGDLASYMLETKRSGDNVQLNFICTHNSRRSHMAQLWAAAAAVYYGIENVHCFSGGTEATAFNRSAINAMERAGFEITQIQMGENPVYEAKMSGAEQPLRMWSKKYEDPLNPSAKFAAVMVCSDADKNCPFVPGAATRIAIPYQDPKASDGTPSESAMYDERCRQISIEMLYTMHLVKEQEKKESK